MNLKNEEKTKEKEVKEIMIYDKDKKPILVESLVLKNLPLNQGLYLTQEQLATLSQNIPKTYYFEPVEKADQIELEGKKLYLIDKSIIRRKPIVKSRKRSSKETEKEEVTKINLSDVLYMEILDQDIFFMTELKGQDISGFIPYNLYEQALNKIKNGDKYSSVRYVGEICFSRTKDSSQIELKLIDSENPIFRTKKTIPLNKLNFETILLIGKVI